MIKRITVLIIAFVTITGCSFESPKEFTKEALEEKLYSLDNTTTKLQNVLENFRGEKIVINVWASWCRDCLIAVPKMKAFQKKFPKVKYVFISTDRNMFSWKKALKKYNIKGEHYFLEKGMDSDLGDFLNSNWIPRYLVINENGFVDLFKAKKITDKRIVNALKK